MMTDKTAKQNRNNDTVKTTAEILIVIILAIVCAGIINATCFTTTRVSGPSMNDTLYGGGDASIVQTTFFDRFFFGTPDGYGDKVMMAKTQKVERGDIIVFHPYGDELQYIKRVIAVAGDVISVVNGGVWLNGVLLEEDYVTGDTRAYGDYLMHSWTVPENCVFVMGDNRRNSTDSRDDRVGFVKESSIVGRVILVVKKDTKRLVLVKNL